MRLRLAAVLLPALLLTACDDAPLGPPEGMDATLLFEPTAALVEVPPQVTVDAGRIVATTRGNLSGCYALDATAGRVGDVVVVTLTQRSSGRFCNGMVTPVTYRVEVAPVPRGRWEVRFFQRDVNEKGETTWQQGLVRTQVEVP